MRESLIERNLETSAELANSAFTFRTTAHRLNAEMANRNRKMKRLIIMLACGGFCLVIIAILVLVNFIVI